jgi:hypothetical protein
MLAWIVFCVVIYMLTAVFASRWEKYVDWRFSHKWKVRRMVEGVSTAVYLFLIIILPIFIVPNFVEFPAWPFQTDVATFTEQGDLVYHPWGLWTPSGREVVNARVGRVLYLNNFDQGNRFGNGVVLIKDNRGYGVSFIAELHLNDPKQFFRIKERRQQVPNLYLYEPFAKESGGNLLKFLTFNHSEVQKVFERCEAKQTDRSSKVYVVSRCDALTGFLESQVNTPKLLAEGLRAKVRINLAQSFVSFN